MRKINILLFFLFNIVFIYGDNEWVGFIGRWLDSEVWSEGIPNSSKDEKIVIKKEGALVKIENNDIVKIHGGKGLFIGTTTPDSIVDIPSLLIEEGELNSPSSSINISNIGLESKDKYYYSEGSIRLISGTISVGTASALGLYNRDIIIAKTEKTKSYEPHATGALFASGAINKPFIIQNYSRGINVGSGYKSVGEITLSGFGSLNCAGPAIFAYANGNGILNISGSNVAIHLNNNNNSKEGLVLDLHHHGKFELNLSFDRKGISPIFVNGDVYIGSNCYLSIELNDFTPSLGQEIILIDGSGTFAGNPKYNSEDWCFVNMHEGQVITLGKYSFRVSYGKKKALLKLIRL